MNLGLLQCFNNLIHGNWVVLVPLLLGLLIEILQVLLYLDIFQWHLFVFGNLNLDPQNIILRNIEIQFTVLGHLLKINGHLLSQILFVVNKNVFGWLLDEVEEAHDKNEPDAYGQEHLDGNSAPLLQLLIRF
jgi:hypothetical protein